MSNPRLVAIVNVTPDSFSDGGAFFKPDDALAAIERLIAEGADVIDIGAESTRPGATPLAHEEEWQRLAPVLAEISRFYSKPACFSVDTRHPETAQRALNYGVRWINDVSGFANPEMIKVVKDSDCILVMMHSLTIPADKSVVMLDTMDVIQELLQFAQNRIAMLEASGIARERIVFDPGIGFGKTAAQSLRILQNINRFQTLDVSILIGHSRKSFLTEFGNPDDATLTVSQYLAGQEVQYLRVHDIVRHRHMLKLREALTHGSH